MPLALINNETKLTTAMECLINSINRANQQQQMLSQSECLTSILKLKKSLNLRLIIMNLYLCIYMCMGACSIYIIPLKAFRNVYKSKLTTPDLQNSN